MDLGVDSTVIRGMGPKLLRFRAEKVKIEYIPMQSYAKDEKPHAFAFDGYNAKKMKSTLIRFRVGKTRIRYDFRKRGSCTSPLWWRKS